MATPASQSVTPAPTKEDSKDFVEHLRTIHFTLLAVCLALIVIALSSSPEVIRKANEQLKDVEAVSALWNEKCPDTCFSRAIEAAVKNPQMRPITGPNFQLGTDVLQFVPQSPYFCFGLPESLNQHFQRTTKIGQGTSFDTQYQIEPPTTLAQFRAIWDARMAIRWPLALSDDIWLFDQSRRLRRITRTLSHANKQAHFFLAESNGKFSIEVGNEGYNLRRLFSSDLSDDLADQVGESVNSELLRKQLMESGCTYYGFEKGSWIIIPMTRSDSMSFALRDTVIETFAKGKLLSLDFAAAFQELDQATAGFQDLDFKHLSNILDLEEKNSPGELFEAFGIKFPKETTKKWGILLILGLQLYFCIHLAEYGRRHFGQSAVAWIGAYAGFVARLTFFVTSIAVPIGVVVYLTFLGREHPFQSRAVADFLLAVCVCLAGLAGRLSRSIAHARPY